MKGDMSRRAENIADAARTMLGTGTMADDGAEVDTNSFVNSTRAGASVLLDHPAALRIEAKHRVLGTCIDAGR